MKFLLIPGSLRRDSLNRKLLKNIASIIKANEWGEVEIADLKQINLPVYDGDIETAGMPESVKKLGEMISKADALITCSPEYNASISAPLKNAIDWVSRLRPVPLEKKPVLLTGASPGGFGSIRALGHTRPPFETLGAYVYPQPFALAKANEAFDENDFLIDSLIEKNLAELVRNFKVFAQKMVL